jgi:hypothetical protein
MDKEKVCSSGGRGPMIRQPVQQPQNEEVMRLR